MIDRRVRVQAHQIEYLVEAEGGQFEAAVARIENTDDDLLAADGGEHGDTEFDAADIKLSQPDAPPPLRNKETASRLTINWPMVKTPFAFRTWHPD